MLTAFTLTWMGVLAAQLSPGPNLAAVASIALAQGRRPALYVVSGVSSGMIIWSMVTALGLGLLIESFPMSLWLLKLIGGSYLLFLGAKAAISTFKGRGSNAIVPDARSLSDLTAWRRGMVVVLTNPKAALMWAAVASYLFGQGLSAWHVIMFGPMGAFSGLIIYGVYAYLFSTGMAVRAYAKFTRIFEGLFAAAFGVMGGRLLWSGLRENS